MRVPPAEGRTVSFLLDRSRICHAMHARWTEVGHGGSCFVELARYMRASIVRFILNDPESKTVKNRMHLDVRVAGEGIGSVVERLTARGARFLHEGRQGPHTWVTLADPEGGEFCVSP